MLDINLKWSCRHDSFADLVSQTARTLQFLGEQKFDSWYHKGWSRKDAMRYRVQPSLEEMEEELNKGTQRLRPGSDIDIYRLEYWNAASDEESCSLLMRVGGTSQKLPRIVNLGIPFKGPLSLSSLGLERINTILVGLIELWNPELASLRDDKIDDQGLGSLARSRLAYLRTDRYSIQRQHISDFALHSIGHGEYARVQVCEEVEQQPSPDCMQRARQFSRDTKEIPRSET